MTAIELATELARLEGMEHQFELVVGQILAMHRERSVAGLMRAPSATPANVAQQMSTLDQALEKLGYNLRSQYQIFLDAQVSFRAANMTIDELQQSVAALRDERVQRYLAKTRDLYQAAGSNTRQVIEKMMQAAMSSAAANSQHAVS